MNQSMHEKMMKMHGGSDTMPEMKKASHEVALKGKKQIAEGTIAFIFEKPKEFKFKAGQHIRMTLLDPPETDAEGDSRFFSLASTPQDADIVIAMRMRDTAFKRVLGDMQTGTRVLSQILLDAPHGAFALHDDATKPAVFIVGGIGIVPTYSMIKDALERKLPHQMFLFYSNRRPEDAPFLGELAKLAEQNSSFKLIATMTEPQRGSSPWGGLSGRINEDLLRKYITNIDLPIYYIAGLPEMVSSMQEMLKKAGVNENQIKAEEFTGFNLNEIVNDVSSQTWKYYLSFIAIGVIIIGTVVVHLTGVQSVIHSSFGSLTFNNPLSYLFISLLLVVILFKLKLLWILRKSRGKQLIRDFRELHRLSRRKK